MVDARGIMESERLLARCGGGVRDHDLGALFLAIHPPWFGADFALLKVVLVQRYGPFDRGEEFRFRRVLDWSGTLDETALGWSLPGTRFSKAENGTVFE